MKNFNGIKKINKEIISGCIISTMLIFAVLPFFAQADSVTFTYPFKGNSIEALLSTIIDKILLPIGGVIAVLMVMYAGFQYVTAQGNPAQITKASKALQYALIGAAILLGAWTISQAIKGTIEQLKT